jgi:hypothetical protein
MAYERGTSQGESWDFAATIQWLKPLKLLWKHLLCREENTSEDNKIKDAFRLKGINRIRTMEMVHLYVQKTPNSHKSLQTKPIIFKVTQRIDMLAPRVIRMPVRHPTNHSPRAQSNQRGSKFPDRMLIDASPWYHKGTHGISRGIKEAKLNAVSGMVCPKKS